MVRRVLVSFALVLLGAVPAHAKINSITINIKTANESWAGTDNDVKVVMVTVKPGFGPVERSWNLDTPNHDDFEKGNYEGFALPGQLPDQMCEIQRLDIVKSPDNGDGGWKLAFIEVVINGQMLYKGNANKWLEDDDLSWHADDWPSFPPCGPPPAPPGIKLPTPIPTCTATVGAGEFQSQKPDADCDGIQDADDPVNDPADTDGDGMCDACEDWNQNGVVDPGETDPKKADTDNDNIPDLFDLKDTDKDCLADIMEDKNRNGIWEPDQGETNWQDEDTDHDGWFDGYCNVRSQLYLMKIECLNEQEDAGGDELFLTFNHARWPSAQNLDGTWSIEGGNTRKTMVEVARRTAGVHSQLTGSTFKFRMDAREDDWFDWTDDDFILDLDQIYQPNSTFIVPYKDDGFWDTTEYKFHFQSFQSWFADPHPLDANADDDQDGLTEKTEGTVTLNMAGLGDPEQKDLYFELDSIGKDQEPERYTKEDIASRFMQHGFAFHLDDGAFGGGQILPYEEEVSLRTKAPSVLSHRKTDFAASRCGVFHYALAVDVVKIGDEKMFGKADRPVKDASGKTLCGSGDILVFKSDFMDHVSDLESIVWIHELGHNLGLCHLPHDNEEVVSTTGGCTQCAKGCNCVHYTNDQWDDSAMGSGFSAPWIDDAIQAIDREIDYDEKEWAVVDARPIQNTASCP